MKKILKQTMPIILTIIGLLSAVTGLLQYIGITHLPVISDFVHPPANQILDTAKATEFTDMSCSIDAYDEDDTPSGPAFSVTISGTCGFTKNPERAIFQEHWAWSSLPPADFTTIYDVSTNTHYTRLGSDSNWTTGAIQNCGAGQICTPSDLAIGASSLPDLYDITGVQFIGSQSVNNEACYHIRGDRIVNGPAATVATTVDLWILQDTHLPARATEQWTTRPSNGDSGDSLSGHETLNFTDYNRGITIPLPSS